MKNSWTMQTKLSHFSSIRTAAQEKKFKFIHVVQLLFAIQYSFILFRGLSKFLQKSKKNRKLRQLFGFLRAFINFPWGHLRSHKKNGLDRLSWFDVYRALSAKTQYFFGHCSAHLKSLVLNTNRQFESCLV